MNRFTDNPFEAQLEVVATIADRNISGAVARLREEDELTLALRESLRTGVNINDLSDATGLPVADIQRRVQADLHIVGDLEDLAGTR